MKIIITASNFECFPTFKIKYCEELNAILDRLDFAIVFASAIFYNLGRYCKIF
ncbi:MAG: hypothetical protein JSC188_001104 [Candidatus Tokpelaia sp. JSC188]|nr:MAG: hypothetical protein JSC188_001104 [Candidatus Tokpelaia sp. JSC188]